MKMVLWDHKHRIMTSPRNRWVGSNDTLFVYTGHSAATECCSDLLGFKPQNSRKWEGGAQLFYLNWNSVETFGTTTIPRISVKFLYHSQICFSLFHCPTNPCASVGKCELVYSYDTCYDHQSKYAKFNFQTEKLMNSQNYSYEHS